MDGVGLHAKKTKQKTLALALAKKKKSVTIADTVHVLIAKKSISIKIIIESLLNTFML